MRKIVLSLFDRTGNMVRPWAEAGCECWCVDIQHKGIHQEGNIRFIGADLRLWEVPDDVEPRMVFAFPPCTDLAVSGARWWKDKGLRSLAEGIGLVAKAHELATESGAPWMIENPVGALSTHWRKPDAQFDPCEFAGYLDDPEQDAYTKRTCLWTGGASVCRCLSRCFRIREARCTYFHRARIGLTFVLRLRWDLRKQCFWRTGRSHGRSGSGR